MIKLGETVYLQSNDLQARSISASTKSLSRAQNPLIEASNTMVNIIENHYGAHFLWESAEEAGSIAAEIDRIADNLESLKAVYNTAPEEIEDADKSFRDWNNKNYSATNAGKKQSVWDVLGITWLLHTVFGIRTVQQEESTVQPIYDPSPKKELSPYEQYRAKADAAEKAVPIGHKQETERSGSGICTYSATTTLLQRRQAVDGHDVSFTFGDVHYVNGGSGQVDSDGIWPDSSFAWGRAYTSDSGETYQMKYEFGATDDTSIKALLDAHPEGVIVWSPSSGGYNHAIVITDYEINENGGIQFYADDPVRDRQYLNGEYISSGRIAGRDDAGRIPIDKTWLAEVNSNIFGSAVVTAYLE